MLHLLSQAYSAPTRVGGIFGFSCGRQVLFLEVTSYKLLLMAGVCLVKSWIQQLRRSLISASFLSLQAEKEEKLLLLSQYFYFYFYFLRTQNHMHNPFILFAAERRDIFLQ